MDDPGPGGLANPPLLSDSVSDESFLGPEEFHGQPVVRLPGPEYVLKLIFYPSWLQLTVD